MNNSLTNGHVELPLVYSNLKKRKEKKVLVLVINIITLPVEGTK